MNPAHREMGIKYFKTLRAKEEIVRLDVEICRLRVWADEEDSAIKHAASDLESTEPTLAAEIWEHYRKQHRVNNIHRSRLASLGGEHACTDTDNGEDEDEWEDERELGEEAARFESVIQRILT
jgi:hypothetical protein